MSTYPLVSTVGSEDLRHPMSRCGDCPYHFYHPFYEESLFKDSDSNVQVRIRDNSKRSGTMLQKRSSRDTSPHKPEILKNGSYTNPNRRDNFQQKEVTKNDSYTIPNHRDASPYKAEVIENVSYMNSLHRVASPHKPEVVKNVLYTTSHHRDASPQRPEITKNDSYTNSHRRDISPHRPEVIKNGSNTNSNRRDKPIPPKVPSLTKGEKSSRHSTISHHNNYHRLRVIHSFMDKLECDYPSICTTGSIGRSLEGRDLKILRISNSNAKNIAVWIDAGIHAREWIAPATATYLADNIAKNFSTLPGYMTNKDWYFLPVMNPDGYEYSHTKDRMWRKNKAWNKGQFVGVDLNRNFSYGWGGFGSSDEPTNVFYHGPFAFSEPESTAVRDMLLNSETKFTVYITLHSYGQVILFPFACKDELCPSYVRLLEGATIMSRAIYNTNGNIYKVGISRDVMYGAAGTSNDWSYSVAGIPYCYLLELRSKKHRFKVPSEEIEETGKEIFNSVKALMEFVDNYKPLKIGSKNHYESDDEDRKSLRSNSTRGSSSTRSARITSSTRMYNKF